MKSLDSIKRRRFSATAWRWLMFTPAALACRLCVAAAGEPDLLDLPIDQLLQASIASKHIEDPADAPASVVVYGASDMQRLGYQTLYELADITPGYGSYRIFGEKVLYTRGQKAASFNNSKHLLLFDDIPLNFPRNFKASVGEEMPLLGASQVEFMRGPGSALYGTSAFFGVIGVSPRQAMGPGRSGQAVFSLGSRPRQWRAFAESSVQHLDGTHSHLQVNFYGQSDSLLPVGPTPRANNLYRDGEQGRFVWASHSWSDGALRGLRLNLIHQQKSGHLGEMWDGQPYTDPANQLSWTQTLVYAKYERQLSDAWQLGGHLRNGTSVEAGHTRGEHGNTSDYSIAQQVWAGAVDLQWHQGDQRWVLGLDLDARRENEPGSHLQASNALGQTSPFHLQRTDPYITRAAYTQWQAVWPALGDLSTTVGWRGDCMQGGGSRFCHGSPRVALVQPLGGAWVTKLLFGSAFRAPGFKEVELNRQTAAAGIDVPGRLAPETFKTYEFTLDHHSDQHRLGVSLFVNNTRDALDASQAGGRNYFVNTAGKTRAHGGEVYAQWHASAGWHLLAEASWANAVDASGHAVQDVPTRKGSISFNQPWAVANEHGDYTLTLRAEGAPQGPSGSTPGHGALDAQVIWSTGPHISWSLRAQNLTDRRAYLTKAGVPSVPLPERKLWLDLRLGW